MKHNEECPRFQTCREKLGILLVPVTALPAEIGPHEGVFGVFVFGFLFCFVFLHF